MGFLGWVQGTHGAGLEYPIRVMGQGVWSVGRVRILGDPQKTQLVSIPNWVHYSKAMFGSKILWEKKKIKKNDQIVSNDWIV